MHFNDHSLQWLNVFLQSRITLAYKRRSLQKILTAFTEERSQCLFFFILITDG